MTRFIFSKLPIFEAAAAVEGDLADRRFCNFIPVYQFVVMEVF
jgi:hypothetical protein